jgi:two-component system sensor histidine kinase/response regulator
MADFRIAAVPSSVQDPAHRGRQLFEDAPIAYHEIDTKGVIREVNKAERQLLGYRLEEMIGCHIWEFVAADQQQAARDAIARKVARQQPASIVTREYRRSDGHYLWVEIHEKLIESAEGEVVGIRSALIDVTERLRVESELRGQRDWMRFVLRSTANAVITADILGHVSMMNPAAEAITGWREEEALGRTMEKICRVRGDNGEQVDMMPWLMAEPLDSDRRRNFVVTDRSGASQSIQWLVSPILDDEEVIVGTMLTIEKS